MREIKFRAWDGEQIFSHDQMRNFDFYHWCESPDVTIMQYTGLKDKNGVEVYEGDIVKYFTNYYGNKQERKKVVEWIDDMQDDSFGEPLSMGYRFHGSEIEVIGNIYENPELLEVGE